ncbi:ABC transporter ATP-binding protein [Spirochaeta cellobiosiphila]|uniref:ABC transporter ATP-binding protein n=1 Tax=Spirochaeta cellobiosiphila TaxID=504483 RepID=UPI000406D833|nr:ABC transporter ATP-binding protein [Spirochaeta cellobiosiphila]
MVILKAKDITMQFGGLRAVSDFNLEMKKGELVGLIGPNGAGKTTCFNMITGVYTPTEGTIEFLHKKSEDSSALAVISGKKSHEVTRMGMARTFQNIRLFKGRTVLENVLVSYHFSSGYNVAQAILRTPAFRKAEKNMKEEALKLLEIFKIDSKAYELASNLPYGEQRKLEIVRALATGARLLLLDEPAAGMNPQETQELMTLIRFIREKFDLTILLIEHDMHLVMGICERIVVLDYGRIIAEGLPAEVSKNPEVVKAYLGQEVDE